MDVRLVSTADRRAVLQRISRNSSVRKMVRGAWEIKRLLTQWHDVKTNSVTATLNERGTTQNGQSSSQHRMWAAADLQSNRSAKFTLAEWILFLCDGRSEVVNFEGSKVESYTLQVMRLTDRQQRTGSASRAKKMIKFMVEANL